MSSSCEYSAPVRMLKYRDPKDGMTPSGDSFQPGASADLDGADGRKEVQLTTLEFAERIARERASAAGEVEERLRNDFEMKLTAARKPIVAAIAEFEQERVKYYARVESEIVQLALAIAAKILHREAQVDPMLVAALVRIAIDNLREGSSVTIRVPATKGSIWQEYFQGNTSVARIAVVEDSKLTDGDCFLETELGSANFSIEKQLKEVEQGFFDLLALRPTAK